MMCPLFWTSVASHKSEYHVNVNFGFSKKNEVSFLYTMIAECIPDFCQVFRVVPPVSSAWESGVGSSKLDVDYVSDETKQSSFSSSVSNFRSDPVSLEAETLPTSTVVEAHMCVPGGEEGVLAFIGALEDCLREYGIEFGEDRGRGGGGVQYYKLLST
jgi:hypothetical protein